MLQVVLILNTDTEIVMYRKWQLDGGQIYNTRRMAADILVRSRRRSTRGDHPIWGFGEGFKPFADKVLKHFIRGKDKVHPRIDHEVPEGE